MAAKGRGPRPGSFGAVLVGALGQIPLLGRARNEADYLASISQELTTRVERILQELAHIEAADAAAQQVIDTLGGSRKKFAIDACKAAADIKRTSAALIRKRTRLQQAMAILQELADGKGDSVYPVITVIDIHMSKVKALRYATSRYCDEASPGAAAKIRELGPWHP